MVLDRSSLYVLEDCIFFSACGYCLSTGLGGFLRFNGVLPPRHDEITASQSNDCDESPSLHLDDFGGQDSDIIMKRLCSSCNVLIMA